ncbi:MAG: hypothetical protein ABL923_06660 [Burkholderiaceae bacterium]
MTANKKASNICSIQGLTNQIDTLNSAHVLPASQDLKANDSELIAESESKATFTLIAHFALAGHAVHKGQSGDFIVTKYGLSRYCQNLQELQDFARQLGM